ncbi:MAG: elongation factor P [bacterium]
MANFASPTELRNGTVFNLEGKTYTVLKYEHNKRGRGHATVKVKVKDIVNGTTTEKTFTSGDNLEIADIARKNAQYLYKDDSKLYFMDSIDYSQFSFDLKDSKWESNFLLESTEVQVLWLDEKPVNFELSSNVDLFITESEMATAGDTATGAMKEAVTETGFKIQVPLFIKTGDKVKISTEDGHYITKA